MPRPTRGTRAALALALAFTLPLTGPAAATAWAETDSTFLPFAQNLRRCDFSEIDYVGSSGYGRPTALMRIEGADVVADIRFDSGVPNTRYEVRVIQMPRSSAASCNPGDPGVASAAMVTDPAGAGQLSVRGPTTADATGAWVFITRPGVHSQIPEEFYTTDLVAAF